MNESRRIRPRATRSSSHLLPKPGASPGPPESAATGIPGFGHLKRPEEAPTLARLCKNGLNEAEVGVWSRRARGDGGATADVREHAGAAIRLELSDSEPYTYAALVNELRR